MTACRCDKGNNASYCSGEIDCSLRAGRFDWRGAEEFAGRRATNRRPNTAASRKIPSIARRLRFTIRRQIFYRNFTGL